MDHVPLFLRYIRRQPVLKFVQKLADELCSSLFTEKRIHLKPWQLTRLYILSYTSIIALGMH